MRGFALARTLPAFAVAAGLYTGLSALRPSDLMHVVATLTEQGGRVRHGAHAAYGWSRYTMLVTGRSALGRRADLDIALEGDDVPPHEVRSSLPPALELGVHEWPGFDSVRLTGVRPGDKFRLWLIMRPEWEDAAEPRHARSLRFVLRDGAGKEVLGVPISFSDPGGDHEPR